MYMCSHLWTFLVFIQKIIFGLADLFNKRVVAVWIALQICTSWYLWLPTIIRKKTFEMTTDRSYIYYLDKSVKGKKYHIDPRNLFKPFPNSQGHIISFLSIIFLIRAKISRILSYVSANCLISQVVICYWGEYDFNTVSFYLFCFRVEF